MLVLLYLHVLFKPVLGPGTLSMQGRPMVTGTYNVYHGLGFVLPGGVYVFVPVFRIRIRIQMFLGLPDPDPLVRGADPDPDSSIIKQNS